MTALIEGRDRAKIEAFLDDESVPVSDKQAVMLQLEREALDTDRYDFWLPVLFPEHVYAALAPHHHEFWQWVWSIGPTRPRPFLGAWARGGAKSTSAEMAAVCIGARKVRKYGLYVSGTQQQADDHVGNIGTLLESSPVGRLFPELGERRVGKYGSSKGWRRNRLWTEGGFVVDAIGLDSAARGAKLDEDRPGFLVFDDIDEESDGPVQVEKKIRSITRKLLPAGSNNLAVLAIQNLVHEDSIFARLAGVSDTPVDFLTDRIISGPIPAVHDLATGVRDNRVVIVSGTPSWEGQSLDVCEEQINEWGLSAFLSEAQHSVEAPPGGMFDHLDFAHISRDGYDVLELVESTCWVDPAVTSTDRSDAHGIQIDSLGVDGTIYRAYSYEKRGTPLDTIKLAITKAVELGATTLGVEVDQGHDTWESVYREAVQQLRDEGVLTPEQPMPRFLQEKAGVTQQSKAARAQQMLTDYEHPGRIMHVEGGTIHVLERALRRFPLTKPYDLVDAAYWSWRYLRPADARGTGQAHSGIVKKQGQLPSRTMLMGAGRRR